MEQEKTIKETEEQIKKDEESKLEAEKQHIETDEIVQEDSQESASIPSNSEDDKEDTNSQAEKKSEEFEKIKIKDEELKREAKRRLAKLAHLKLLKEKKSASANNEETTQNTSDVSEYETDDDCSVYTYSSDGNNNEEWDNMVHQLQIVIALVLIPLAGKFLGRRFAHRVWGIFAGWFYGS